MGGWEREEEVKVCVEVDIYVGGVQESTYPGHCLHRNSGADLWMNGGERKNRGKGLEREREERKGEERGRGRERGEKGRGERGRGREEGEKEGGEREREGGRANKKKVGR